MAARKKAGAAAPAKKSSGSAKGGAKNSSAPAGTPKAKKSWVILFWLAFAITLFGFFIFNRETITSSVQNVRNEIIARNSPKEPEPVIVETPPVKKTEKPAASTPKAAPAAPQPAAKPAPRPPVSSQPPAKPAASPTPAAQPAAKTATPPASQNSQTKTNSAAPAAQSTNSSQSTQAAKNNEPVRSTADLRERTLYFAQVDKDGSILRIKVSRKLPVSDSPMTDVLQALISGPLSNEKSKGLISLIPSDTEILSATVRGETAYISFSEEFQYNTYGVEGYAAQLKQIVYTVTEFPNIKDVQILIEGRRVDFLGEGIWIGSPLNRTML